MPFDLAIVEAGGNGGDIQIVGNDLAVVFDIENWAFLAIAGGNIKEDTVAGVVKEQSFDWWGNNLFYKSQPSLQFNSKTERTLSTVALNSEGRILLTEAVKSDCKFIVDAGYKVDVEVTIPEHDHVSISIRTTRPTGGGVISIINYKKSSDGDFYIMDFNNDFFV